MSLKQIDGGKPALESASAAPVASHLKFGANDGFQTELRRRVDRYFQFTRRRPRDCPRMYIKSGLIILWFVASYVLLIFFAAAWWQAVPLAVSLGLSIAAVGFNIQHDGGHRAYSNSRWINKLMAMTMDLTGGSSYMWARKHNTIHHSYANITGHDDDINLSPLGRLSPHQPWLPFHRLQHFYLWVFYGLLPVKWLFFDDFRNAVTGKIGSHRIARPKGWDLVTFIAGKTVAFTLTFGIPLFLHSPWLVLLFYGVTSLVLGITLSVVFQLAHCVEGASFPMPLPETGRIEAAWAVHQVETTVDFARSNRLVSWFIGGLNFQIEHHLFPGICHIHYPRLSRLVEKTCRRFGVKYRAHKTMLSAIASHFRWLRQMGTVSTA